jgi:hypothetical protein
LRYSRCSTAAIIGSIGWRSMWVSSQATIDGVTSRVMAITTLPP